MAARQPAPRNSENIDSDEARPLYVAALRSFAQAATDGLNDALVAALYPLNAVYYLRDLLPHAAHLAAVRVAAGRLMAAANDASPAHAVAAAALRPVRLQTLIRGAGTRADSGTAATLLQHALEIEPQLARPEVRTLRAALRDRLLALPAASDQRIRLRATAGGAVGDWAACNARPPREGEIAAWAACLGRRPAIELAEQALAGGLRFPALLDVLSLAASQQCATRPSEETAAGLIAAHAVRRLTEIAQAPALVAWLGVAGALASAARAPALHQAEPVPDPAKLALAAVQSGDPLLIQAAEAALMETEALPAELRPAPLLALARLLETEGRGDNTAMPAAANQAYAAVNAARGSQS